MTSTDVHFVLLMCTTQENLTLLYTEKSLKIVNCQRKKLIFPIQ